MRGWGVAEHQLRLLEHRANLSRTLLNENFETISNCSAELLHSLRIHSGATPFERDRYATAIRLGKTEQN